MYPACDGFDQEEAVNTTTDESERVRVTNPWALAPGEDKSRTGMAAYMGQPLLASPFLLLVTVAQRPWAE